jgi:hypothetical protein
MLSLRELQSRFFYSIARPVQSPDQEWQGFDPQLLEVIRPQGQLGAQERLDIYAQMYCARLLDALLEDFPRATAIIGEAQFRELGRTYLRQYPSIHPSLRYLGDHFPQFVTTHHVSTSLPFLPDLVRLERTRVNLFDAPDAEPLRSEDLQTILPEAWATIRFRIIPALEILSCVWPVHRIWQDEAFTKSDNIQPESTILRIWRQDFSVYQVSMDAVEHAALAALSAGEPFAAVCEAMAPLVDASEDISATIGSLLLRWIEDGVLCRVYDV